MGWLKFNLFLCSLFAVEIPEDSDKDLFLSSDFMNNCVRMFSVPSRVGDKTPLVFPKKNLNIIDPLKDLNNLGRSVSKGMPRLLLHLDIIIPF